MSPGPNHFGTLLKQHRLRAVLSQLELAEMVDMSVNGIGALERGKRTRPYPETVKRLATALKLTNDELLTFLEAAHLDRGSSEAATLPDTNPALPVPLTSFVGREQELETLKTWFTTARLVTLTGVGGCGKTRLALQFAATTSDAFPTGARFVELAPITDPDRVSQVLADAMKVPPPHPSDSAGEHLIVVDNAEHLLDAAAAAIHELLKRHPSSRFLVTSREPLALDAEAVFPVLPLDVPDPTGPLLVDQLEQYSSVRLFLERARARRPDIALTPATAASIARICHILDGIPLALELAAARASALSIEELAELLDHVLVLLVSDQRMIDPRRRALRATLDWSYIRLSPAEQLFLQQLAIFVGGWTLSAAKAICGDDGLTGDSVLQLLTALVDKSLVVFEERDGTGRYRLLEVVRQYAQEHLGSGAEYIQVRDRHRAWYLQLVEDAQAKHEKPTEWAVRIRIEQENLRVALGQSGQVPDPTASGDSDEARMARALWRLWMIHGHLDEGIRYLDAILADKPRTLVKAKALNAKGSLFEMLGRWPECAPLHEESMGLFEGLGDEQGIASTLLNLAVTDYDQGFTTRARIRFESSLDHWRRREDVRGGAAARAFLSRALLFLYNDVAAAAEEFDRCATLYQSLQQSSTWGLAAALAVGGHVAARQGAPETARIRFQESLRLAGNLGHTVVIADCLEGLAGLSPALPAARHWLEAAADLQAAYGRRRPVPEVAAYAAIRADVDAQTSIPSLAHVHLPEQPWPLSQVLRSALAPEI